MNIRLLEGLFYRIVKLFDDYSDLKIRINNLSLIELIFPNIADVIEFWPRTVLDDERIGKSKAAETIRNIGYCNTLKELALRMDLIGI